ncbi:hypothetical protein AB6E53_02445 [Vibrio breoganii]|uniref:Uncharacterized protein n=1 Tax=Vibrio breoganii TaxID=553239 RepID=A0AAP8MVQ6_9VIBR|nr:hypothetical protein [Vibrio breoganii]PMP10247.1 hypothetical protein BCS93_11265 [Vibrio breoganii]
MGKSYIENRVQTIQSNRRVGKVGLSSQAVRCFDIKVRFTDEERLFFESCADFFGTSKSVYANAIMFDSLIDILASSPEFYHQTKAKYLEQGGDPSNPMFNEINNRMREDG